MRVFFVLLGCCVLSSCVPQGVSVSGRVVVPLPGVAGGGKVVVPIEYRGK